MTTTRRRRIGALVVGVGVAAGSTVASASTDTTEAATDTTAAATDTTAASDTTTGDSTAGTTAGSTAGTMAAAPTGAGGGEIIDAGTFALGPAEHLDPALNTTLDAYQLINAMYDGLTDIDSSDPSAPVVVPDLATSYEANEDASVWTFTIAEGLQFADGEPILPSTFQRSWERASNPDMAAVGQYSYLFNFIEGGAEKIAGEGDTLTGVVADDEAMTLTVTLSAPYANFPAVAGFQLFFPVPEAADEAGLDYENQLMVGNGPYTLEAPRSDDSVVLVKNENWDGDFTGNTYDTRPDKVTVTIPGDADASYTALEAGEADIARIPSGRTAEAMESWGTSAETAVMGTYFFQINSRDASIGGPENLELRRAISLAIDREALNDAVFDGARVPATGLTPPGIPGYEEGLCENCAYDPEAAQAAFDAWTEAGGVQAEPLRIQYNAGGVHADVVQLIIENLAAVGIQAETEEFDSETYFTQLAEGACQICRSGWFADYPAYDNFLYDLFSTDSLDGNNYGYSNEEFDGLVAEAKQTVDETARNDLFHQAENILLNEDIGTIPLLFYRGDYAYDAEKLQGFQQNPMGLLDYQKIVLP